MRANGNPWLKLARATVASFRTRQPVQPTTEATGTTLDAESIWEDSSGVCEKLCFDVNDLVPAKLLGHGTFGRVYLCALPHGTSQVKAAGETVRALAVKVVPRECRPVEDTDMEVRILHRLKGNPQIVQLLVACRSPFHDTLVFPAYDGTLHDMLQRGEIRTQVMSK